MSEQSSRGGFRPGSGRPRGTGKYGEPTKAIRVPVKRVAEVRHLLARQAAAREPAPGGAAGIFRPAPNPPAFALTLYATRVAAGFPSPAEDYVEGALDLNRHLVRHPAATFFVRVAGDSMINAGIHTGDILIVDRSLEARDGKVVIAVVDGELTVKRLRIEADAVWLAPENDGFEPIRITEAMRFEIWGVVTNVIHPL